MSMKPTVGRVVLYFPSSNDLVDPIRAKCSPYPAVITHVFGDTCVNLAVQNDGSFPIRKDCLSPTSVTMAPDAENVVEGRCWAWMPFQIGQAAKNDGDVKALRDELHVVKEELRSLEAELAKEHLPHLAIPAVGVVDVSSPQTE